MKVTKQNIARLIKLADELESNHPTLYIHLKGSDFDKLKIMQLSKLIPEEDYKKLRYKGLCIFDSRDIVKEKSNE